MDDAAYISSLVAKARAAQALFARDFDQEAVDRIIRQIAKVTYYKAEELARMAADETAMGGYEYKVKKIRGKARIFWYGLRDKKSMGVISRDPQTGITEIAKPVGVVGAIQPCTNPIVTPLGNTMAALKGKNAIIIAPHPRGKLCTRTVVALWRELLVKNGAPADVVQDVEDISLERTKLLMQMADVVVATGGHGMVKAAYSSGKPSFGVGAGNVQVVLDRGIDLKAALAKIIEGRTFDNGIICAGEQTIIAPKEMMAALIVELKAQKVHVTESVEEKARVAACLFPRKATLNKDLIGKPISAIAAAAGLTVRDGTVAIAIPVDAADHQSDLRREKMFPVLALFSYGTFDEALAIVEENLSLEGKGHTVSIHSNDTANIEKLGTRAPVSRVIVNAPSATTAGGSFSNGLSPTSTLGCGSWGNNSISENFYYRHLLNITRIATVRPDCAVPSDEELFGPRDEP
ncbi:MAG: aldehyde dehydrogenase family protein [Spirochaetia bacterium]|jgi:succinate-semialdehyde dehydrogenase